VGMGLRHKYRGIAVAKIKGAIGLLSLSAFQLGPQSLHEVPGIGGDSRPDGGKSLCRYSVLA
jgi:hypothetical protein